MRTYRQFLTENEEQYEKGKVHTIDDGTIKWSYSPFACLPRRQDITDEQMWEMIKENIQKYFEYVNNVPMTKEMQEYVIQNRPDLIGKIKNLDPQLMKKYKYEYNLSRVEI